MADDDEDDRELTRDALQGARTVDEMNFVTDGQDLIDYLRHAGAYAKAPAPRPSIILLDLNMPRKDGREALAEIKADESLRRIPIVVLTDGPGGAAHYEHATAARALGLPLIALADLRTRGERLQGRCEGQWRDLDVVYRRSDEDRLRGDDGELTAVAQALLAPWRAGRLALVNGFGVGVADDKLTHAYVEAMIRFYCDEEPLLRRFGPTHEAACHFPLQNPDPEPADAAVADGGPTR